MKRLAEAKANLVTIYALYNVASAKPLPEINLDDETTLKKLLDVIQRREALAYVQKNKKAIPKEVTELKRSLADVMLLLDGVDIMEIKAKNKVTVE